MTAPVAFTVLGVPIPKGSSKGFFVPQIKRVVITNANAKTKTWEQQVLEAAVAVLGEDTPPLEGPLTLTVRFYLPRAKSAARRVVKPTTRPDLDKLVRAVKDALTRAGVYHDDGQVVAVIARKDFAAGLFDPLGDRGLPRAEIVVDACMVTVAPAEQLPLADAAELTEIAVRP